jgi:hypothetical protein
MAAIKQYKRSLDITEPTGPLSFGTICVGKFGESLDCYVPIELCSICEWGSTNINHGRYCSHPDALKNWRRLLNEQHEKAFFRVFKREKNHGRRD